MTIKDIKKRMIEYRDFYGQDIVETDAIENAKNKHELRAVLNNHKRFLENQHIDSLTHHENFIKELGLLFF